MYVNSLGFIHTYRWIFSKVLRNYSVFQVDVDLRALSTDPVRFFLIFLYSDDDVNVKRMRANDETHEDTFVLASTSGIQLTNLILFISFLLLFL